MQADCEVAGSCLPPVTGTRTYLQDTRDWYAVHGGGKTASCNILFADGSVKEFSDLNGDKFLNPGFPVPDNLTPADYAKTGYRDGTVELPPQTGLQRRVPDQPPETGEVRIGFPRRPPGGAGNVRPPRSRTAQRGPAVPADSPRIA